MALPDCKELMLHVEAGILTITLNRPHKRNAMNAELVSEIMAVVDSWDVGGENVYEKWGP